MQTSYHTLLVGCGLGLILFGFTGATCHDAKVVARTVNEVARDACEASFGEKPPPDGLTAREICAQHERLKPFIDAILAARQDVGVALGEPQD